MKRRRLEDGCLWPPFQISSFAVGEFISWLGLFLGGTPLLGRGFEGKPKGRPPTWGGSLIKDTPGSCSPEPQVSCPLMASDTPRDERLKTPNWAGQNEKRSQIGSAEEAADFQLGKARKN